MMDQCPSLEETPPKNLLSSATPSSTHKEVLLAHREIAPSTAKKSFHQEPNWCCDLGLLSLCNLENRSASFKPSVFVMAPSDDYHTNNIKENHAIGQIGLAINSSSLTLKENILVIQLCPVLRPHGLCSPPGSSIHEILQARIVEWVAIPFSRGFSQPRDPTGSPALLEIQLPFEPSGKPSSILNWSSDPDEES